MSVDVSVTNVNRLKAELYGNVGKSHAKDSAAPSASLTVSHFTSYAALPLPYVVVERRGVMMKISQCAAATKWGRIFESYVAMTGRNITVQLECIAQRWSFD